MSLLGQPGKAVLSHFFVTLFLSVRKLEKAVAVSGVCAGVLEKKLRESPGKLFPDREVLQILGFRAPGKAEPAGNLGSTLPGPCPRLPCKVFLEIDSSSLLEFLWVWVFGLQARAPHRNKSVSSVLFQVQFFMQALSAIHNMPHRRVADLL